MVGTGEAVDILTAPLGAGKHLTLQRIPLPK
jgi:hypothetical protein